MLFYSNAFEIVQKGVFQPLHRPHAHVSMPLQSRLVYSSLDNTLLIAEWTQFYLHTEVSQALLSTPIMCVSIPLLPFLSLSFFHTRHVPLIAAWRQHPDWVSSATACSGCRPPLASPAAFAHHLLKAQAAVSAWYGMLSFLLIIVLTLEALSLGHFLLWCLLVTTKVW